MSAPASAPAGAGPPASAPAIAVSGLRKSFGEVCALAANSVGFLAVFPLTFISSAFVPVDSMPAALQWFAEINPFTIVVNAMRALWIGAPAGNNIWGAVVWSLVLIAIFAPLAVSRYRRTSGR